MIRATHASLWSPSAPAAPAPRAQAVLCFQRLDRSFLAVEEALQQLAVVDPQSLRSPQPVEDLLDARRLPAGGLLILSPAEYEAAQSDIEETVRDERSGGCIFTTLPDLEELDERARSIRELAAVATTFGFHRATRPLPAQRLGRTRQLALPTHLSAYRFLVVDAPGFRVALIARELVGGAWAAFWTGDSGVVAELRNALAEVAAAAGHPVPERELSESPIEGLDAERDVWAQAELLRAHRVVREAELREVARQAALRGVELRRERRDREARHAAAG